MSLKDQVTPEEIYEQRRLFLKTSIYAASAVATIGAYRFFRPALGVTTSEVQAAVVTNENPTLPVASVAPKPPQLFPTPYEHITSYNNFYEFSTDKERVASLASKWQINKWALQVDGLVEKPLNFSLEDILKIQTEERIYRFRCVEGWSMVIPWLGFPLEKILAQAKPLAKATHVAFESYYDEKEMPAAKSAGIDFPYVEGLRLDEAMNPLTLMATGLYKKSLPQQNGAPIRLVVPWKYGFKSIKSVVKITVTDHQPPTTWNLAGPREYGFYSNVNPEVDHPRWSQKQERRIGELGLVETLKFNGYADQVEKLYAGMNLQENF